MERTKLFKLTEAEIAAKGMNDALKRRLDVSPLENSPVEQCISFAKKCLTESCGKCVPCRVGINKCISILESFLNGNATEQDFNRLQYLLIAIQDSSDCSIGSETAKTILESLNAYKNDFLSYIKNGSSIAKFNPVPCKSYCPAHVNIPAYIALVGAGRYDDAIKLIRYDNPFPAACALVCEHPCEMHCRRNIIDAPVNIRGVKRYAIDKMSDIVENPKKAEATNKKVAVVGGGPAGLTCAYFLALMGHSVTVYEQHSQLGGMMRYGIPRYRLPDSYLMKDINNILSVGIDVKLNYKINEENFNELKNNYDAIFIGIGAHAWNELGIESDNANNVISAVEFLRDMGDNKKYDFTGKHVVVVGGGNVAMDCTRTAMRLGAASVKCIYRRRKEDMTALVEEVSATEAEGCEIITMKSPTRIITNEKGEVTGIAVMPQIPGDVVAGRPKPLDAKDKKEEVIPCDIIIAAIGQVVDSKAFSNAGIATNKNKFHTNEYGAIIDSTRNNSKVFSGGDCSTGPATVIRAVEAGKVAARSIDNFLGYNHVISREIDIPKASCKHVTATGRIDLPLESTNLSKTCFDLVENNFSHEEAMHECSRCLRCDHYGYGSFRGGEEAVW